MLRKLPVVLIVFFFCAHAFAQCSSPKNAIVAENCLPGNDPSQWQVSGIGDSTIQGFATDMSVNAGQPIDFKIETTASAYTIAIFRIGYYGGMGARKVATISPSAKLPQSQPACIVDSATNLYDCGNWAVSASWMVPTTAVPGVYMAVLTRTDTGGASQIAFVVRNDSSTSDIVFQTADETWQAYNPYGGHSLYGPTNFDLTNRAYKVSYNRPFNTLSLENESWIMYAEYPMIRWLEANGYDVTYISSVDSARSGTLIKNHRLFLSVGHDEYWSGPKRTNVEAARDAGVDLAFFSGNEVFWKTRWENSVDGSNTPYRTLACYKETLGPNSNPVATAAVDPLDPPTWTGTWRDPTKSPPADGGRPENALTGQLFRVNGPGTDNTNLAIKIPAAQGKARFWRNTQVGAQLSGTWTLPGGSLGYEWDAEEDNGFRPAGLFDLSTATYNLTTDYLQDYGGLYGGGTATHHMSMYRAPSGALVFGAGTVQWSWGLDAHHDGSGFATDPNIQQATVNLFADMGVQPATVQAGLSLATKSTDTTPPISVITSPANGTAVQAGTTITVTGTASDAGGGIVAGVEVSVDSGTTWHPVAGTTSWSYTWVANKAGTFTIISRAVDDSANLETPSAGASVEVLGVTSLTITPSTLGGGSNAQGTVTLSATAPSGGTTVTLTNSNPSVATIPPSVLVPGGTSSATFQITTVPVGVPNTVTVTATYATSVSATLTVNPVFPPPPGTIGIDAITSLHQSTSSSAVTSSPFSTVVGNELLLAFIGSDAVNPNMTVTGVTGAGLTWTLVVRTNAQGGTAEIWKAFAPTTLTNATATASFSQSSPAASITIMSFAGIDTSGTGGSGAIGATTSKSAASGAPSASLTTTRNGSWVLAAGTDYLNAIARTAGTNQTLVDQYLTATGDTLWTQRQNAATPASGTSVTINDTAPSGDSYNLSLVEVKPVLAGPYSISGNASVNGAGAIVTLTGAINQTTVTADASGNYSFNSLIAGTYTIAPAKSGLVFSPATQSVTISTNSVSGINFTASATYSISGTISPTAGASGATVTLSGADSTSTTADTSGNFSFTGLVNGTYTVTPSKLGYGFTPSSQTVTINGGNITAVNFTATAQNFSISGSLSTAGANATVALSGGATASTTADTSGNYSFAGLGNGTYTVTPTKTGYLFNPTSQTTTVAGANVTGLNFTAQPVSATALAIDVNVSKDNSAANTTIVSSAFSTTSTNELLLALIASDALSPNMQVTGITGAGLTWTLVGRTNARGGTSEIWKAFASATLSNVTATATFSQNAPSASMTIISLSGADTSGTGGSGAIGALGTNNAASGAPTASLTTTRNNSWVLGIGNDYSQAIARTLGSNQTLIHQYLSSTGDTFWSQRQNATTGLSGTVVTINDTAPTADSFNLQLVEVLASVAGPYSISGTISPVSGGAGATVTLSGAASLSTTADGSGNYTFTGLNHGTYTITPQNTGYVFTPPSQTVTVNSSNLTGVNFTAGPLQPVLSLSAPGALFSTISGANPAPTNIQLTNTGNGVLNFTVSSDSPWLTATPTSGTAPQALQLSASINGLALGTYIGHVTVTSPGSSGSPATITVTLKVNMATDWLMVEHDEARTGTAVDETTLSTANVVNLQLLWQTTVDAAVTAQPLYVHSYSISGQTRDLLVVGTGGNTLWVLDANTGALLWNRNFGAPTPNTWGLPDGFGIEGPPVIDRGAGRIYLVSTDGNFRVVSLNDGTDVYAALTLIPNPVTNKVWGGLNRVGNSIYIATASNGGDVAPWRGTVYQVDISSTPKLANSFVVVPSIPAPNGGGGIWGYGGVSSNLVNGNIYAASAQDSVVGSNGQEGYTPYSDSMIALTTNVSLLGTYQPPQPTTYSCGAAPCDLDFASTPLVFQPAGCPTMLAAGNKNGNLYLFKESDLIAGGQPLQILTLNAAADSLGSGGIGGTPVFNPANNMLYISDAGPGVTGVNAGLVGMKMTTSCTLQVVWSNAIGGNDSPNSTPTLANGVLYLGQGNTGVIHAYDPNTGAELWHSGGNYPAAATFASPIVAGGRVYAGSWTSFNGGGVVGAFALPTSTYSVSGTVSPSSSGTGTILTLSGAGSGTVPADSSGNYTFTGLANGTYTVTPSKVGYSFSPASQTATVNGANVTGVNFTASAQTWTISGNVSTNGAGATVNLSGTLTGSTTADSSGNYSFAGLPNGNYTVTPTKSGYTFSPASQNVVVNNGNPPVVNFTATQNTGTGLQMDAKVWGDGSSAKTTIATPAFSTTTANELLLAFVATDYISGNNTNVTGIAGAGLSWTLVKRTNTQSGTAEIWRAFATTTLSNVTVTATLSQSVVSSMTVIGFTGVDTSGSGGANAIGATGTGNSSKGAPTASLVTTRNNSWVFGVGNDYDNAISRTPGANQTVVHQFLTPAGDTYWVQMQNSTTPLSGTTVTINDTTPTTDRYNLSTAEVRTP